MRPFIDFDDMPKIKIHVKRTKTKAQRSHSVSVSRDGVISFGKRIQEELISKFKSPKAVIRVRSNQIGIKIIEDNDLLDGEEGRAINKKNGVVSAKQILTNADQIDRNDIDVLLNSEKALTWKFTEDKKNLHFNKDASTLILNASNYRWLNKDKDPLREKKENK